MLYARNVCGMKVNNLLVNALISEKVQRETRVVMSIWMLGLYYTMYHDLRT
jgi:hypothetical protein